MSRLLLSLKRRRSLAWLLLLLLISAPPLLAVGGQFGLEFAIDAPWRIEPVRTRDGGYTYGPIPIVVTFHDTVFERARNRVSSFTDLNPIDVGRLLEIRVIEWTQDQPHPRHPVTVVPAREIREIERKKLVSTRTAEPDHDICRPSPTESCAAELEIAGSHEWHGTFWYSPRAPVSPGRNIHLEVIVVTERGGFFRNEWRNFLVVHAGEQPLPRFADDWLYGDFHYHSQMTDNEGESAYSYRNVARALGAMGLDFVFATDHASNGTQIDGAIPSEYCADRREEKCFEARDFNAPRFLAAKSLLYGADGVNDAIERERDTGGLARLHASNILPQVYLGEEVDVIPEITKQEYAEGAVRFGDGLRYPWPDVSKCIGKHGVEPCKRKYSRALDDSYQLLDEQGIPVEEKIEEAIGNETVASIVKVYTPDLTRVDPSRQHLVYFPTSTAQTLDGWIGSDTTWAGGGSKRLQTVLREIEGRGVAFLAHPLTDQRPGGPTGPDIVPYSDLELTQAWQSPAILGLQFWNENDRYRSAPDRRSPTVMFVGSLDDEPRTMLYSWPWPFQGHRTANFPWFWQRTAGANNGRELYHGAFTWDRYLRKGLDPGQIQGLTWLKRGEPRKWFMAGGSDSHGDLNFRRYGRPGVERWTDVPVGDTAIGNPRNLVSMTAPPASLSRAAANETTAATGPLRYPNRAVIDSLQAGRFSVTDGPAIRIAIDRNLNGMIDALDIPMGGTFDFFPGDRIPVLVEWLSTPEFGPVGRVDVYVGNERVTFAPKGHGFDIPSGRGEYGSYQPDPSGTLQVQLADAWGRFNRAPLPANTAYHGVARVYLGPAQFQLANADKSLSYVRAFAVTIPTHVAADQGLCPRGGTAGSRCGSRQAYSNPIWSRYNASCPARRRIEKELAPTTAPTTALGVRAFVDTDQNSFPDTCEDRLQDACRVSTALTHGDFATAPTHGAIVRERSTSSTTTAPERPIPATSCQKLEAR